MLKLYAFIIFFLAASYHSLGQKQAGKMHGKTENKNSILKDILPAYVYFSCRVVEVPAAFGEGDDAWDKFLKENVDTLVPKFNGAPPGIYVVSVFFLVNKEGIMAAVKPITNLGYGLEDEVIRIIKTSPKWRPALRNGRVVNEWRKQDVNFIVSELLITGAKHSSLCLPLHLKQST